MATIDLNWILSVIQLGESSTTRLYLVGDEGDIADKEINCNYDFSGVVTTNSSNTIIKGHLGSKATVKFLNEGKILFFNSIKTNIFLTVQKSRII